MSSVRLMHMVKFMLSICHVPIEIQTGGGFFVAVTKDKEYSVYVCTKNSLPSLKSISPLKGY